MPRAVPPNPPRRRRAAFGVALVALVGIVATAVGLLILFPRSRAVSPSNLGDRVLVAVGEAKFAPFTFLRDGEAAGFDVDLLREVARRKGIKLDIRLMDWDAATQAIKRGEADILLGVSELEERRSWLSFSERMLTMKSSLFTNRDSYAYSRVQDLGPETAIGVEGGDVVAQYLAKTYPALNLRPYANMASVMEALARRDLEFAALDYYSGLLSLQQLHLQGTVKIIGDAILEAAYCLGVRKGNEALLIPLNDGLEALKADGTIDRLRDRWLGTSNQVPTGLLVVLGALGAAALGGLALLGWNLALRRAVRQRTAELEESTETSRLYMEHSPVHMYIKDESLRILRLSRSFETFYGRPLAELIGQPSRGLMEESEAAKVDKYDKEVLATGLALELVEEIRGRIYSSIRFPIPRASGRPCLAGFLLDITDKTRAEAKVLRALKEKETLLRELHHRTKNTLQVIRGIVQLEGGEFPDNEELQALVRKTEDRIQAISLVHQMLYRAQDLSRLSIKAYLEELCALMKEGFEGGSGRIALDLEVIDRDILLDVALPLGLIVNELLTNAFTHAFPDEGEGRIGLALSAGPDGGLLLAYEDTGVGFPPGFDVRNQPSLGLRLILSIGEEQLLGKAAFEAREGGGVAFTLAFRDDHYRERV